MAKKKTLRRLTEVVPVEQQQPEITKPEDHLGEALILVNFKPIKGSVGDYYHLECALWDENNPEDVPEETFIISTGSYPVKNALELLDAARDLPLVFSFAKSGRSWIMQ